MPELDNYGNKYSDGYESLLLVQEGSTDFTLHSSAKTIYGSSKNDYAFFLCRTTLATVSFSKGSLLQTIQPFAFYSCQLLSSIDLSQCTELTTINESAFLNCIGLSSITFPPSLSFIGVSAFSNTGLTSVSLPKNVATLGKSAFQRSKKLSTVTFEKDILITELLWYTFGETAIAEFAFPSKVSVFDAVCFEGTNSMKNITSEGNSNFLVINGAICTSDGKHLAYLPPLYTTGKYEIPEGVESIGIEAFAYSQMTEVTMPESLITLSSHAFIASQLVKISFSDSVTSIGYRALYGCISLTEVRLSNGLKDLASEMFQRCYSLTTITIPESVTVIGSSCFKECTKLKDVILPSNITTLEGGAFAMCPNLNLTFAPGSPLFIDKQNIIYSDNKAYISQYIGTEETNIVVPNTVKTIGVSSFQGKTNVVNVTFENDSKLTKIQRRAFSGCTSLQTFEAPPNLAYIEESAFEACTALHSIHLMNKMKSIARKAFKGCSNLTTVVFDDILVEENGFNISDECFNNCSSLTTITLCEGLTNIGAEFAKGCELLTSITLPSTLESIGENAFSNSGIETVDFKGQSFKMTTIGDKAFYGATKLKNFTFTSSITTIGIMAFGKTAIESISLPPSIETLKSWCFKDCVNLASILSTQDSSLATIDENPFEGCINLKLINFNNGNFKTVNGILFSQDETKLIIYPPASSTKFIYIPTKVTMIEPSAFYSCNNLVIVTIPDDSHLSTIGAKAFAECQNLRTINIPIHVKNIGSDAFLNCNKLSCGLFILNKDSAFRENLLNNAKIPKICLKECSELMAKASCKVVGPIVSRLAFVAFFELFIAS